MMETALTFALGAMQLVKPPGEVRDQAESMLAIVNEKIEEGNLKFLESFNQFHKLEKVGMLVQGVKEVQHQRTHPKTWKAYKHPSTIF